MKTILCYGDSNTWGASPIVNVGESGRYDIHTRWTGVLRDELGADYWVIEEGLGGRTTVHNDPIEGDNRNGRTYLAPCLESHRPLDLVAIMLGTNDLKYRFSVSAWDVSRGMGQLIDLTLKSRSGPNFGAPQVLVICPPPFATLTHLADMMRGGEEKSHQLAVHFEAVANTYGVHFLNAGDYIVSCEEDGIHLAPSEHPKLGKAVAAKVREIFGV